MIAFRVLIVDDDADDRDLLREALAREGVEPILTLESVQQVFTYLQRVERDEDLPVLIVTDLNMNGTSGEELLTTLKGMQRYQHIPVVMYSTSSHPRDMHRCLLAGATQYLTKPNSFAAFKSVASQMKTFALG